MKIALAQTNPILGDFDKNCEKILHYTQQAADAGCSLIIFPEMALAGSPPQDLLLQSSFYDAQKQALLRLQKEVAKIVAAKGKIDVVLGCFSENAGKKMGAYYKVATVVLRGGEIACQASRKRLVDADSPAPHCSHRDKSIYFFSIGESFFAATADNGTALEDSIADILATAKKEKVSLSGIINLAASPFFIDKKPLAKKAIAALVKESGVPFFYCNQAGGQGGLIFAGGSFAINGQGEEIAAAEDFCEELLIVDSINRGKEVKGKFLDYGNSGNSDKQPDFLPTLHNALVTGLRDYLHKSGFSKAVLGLSGGIDSALTATLAVDALGSENVLGVALPSPYSSKESVEDAKQLAKNLGCRFEILPIGGLFKQYKEELQPLFMSYKKDKEDVTEQNLQARIRGNLLMALSNKFNAMLLNTGNKSEAAVGYSTLYGDMCGGLAVIGDLPKGLVYALADYLNDGGERIPQRTITKAPSAELKPGQKDQDELPPYEVLDQIIELFLAGSSLEGIIKKGFDPAMVEDTLRRIRINEYKRKQAPVTLQVSVNSFLSRHYPVIHNFRG